MAEGKVKQEQRRADRTFVKALTGHYDEIFKGLYNGPIEILAPRDGLEPPTKWLQVP